MDDSHPMQHVVGDDVERKRKFGLFLMDPINAILLGDDSFDVMWRGVVDIVMLHSNERMNSSIIDTANELDKFFRDQLIFHEKYGRMPTFAEVYSAFCRSSFVDTSQYMNISIPIQASPQKKSFIIAELERIRDYLQNIEAVKVFKFNPELIGIYGKSQPDKLKRYLGVYILKKEHGLSYSEILSGRYNVTDEYLREVNIFYGNIQRADPHGCVKDDYRLAKDILVNIENGYFPFQKKEKPEGSTSARVVNPRLFVPILPILYKKNHFEIDKPRKRRRFHLKRRGGKQSLK